MSFIPHICLFPFSQSLIATNTKSTVIVPSPCVSILPESYCNVVLDRVVEAVELVSILPESYCNFGMREKVLFVRVPVSILPESYCNFSEKEWEVEDVQVVSILPESYCNIMSTAF